MAEVDKEVATTSDSSKENQTPNPKDPKVKPTLVKSIPVIVPPQITRAPPSPVIAAKKRPQTAAIIRKASKSSSMFESLEVSFIEKKAPKNMAEI